MTSIGAPGHDAVPIGDVSAPPFARLPDPSTLFAARAARFAQLAEGHDLGPYLRFLSGIAAAQAAIVPSLPQPGLASAEDRARARDFGMPPLDRTRFAADPAWVETLDLFLAAIVPIDMPGQARGALDALIAADAETRIWMAGNVVDDAIPFAEVPEHLLLAAALQVHAAQAASALDADRLVPVGEGACPACGSAPSASLVVGWEGAHGARFCACALCGTLWNYTRIRCTACGSTKGISYQEVEGQAMVKAESCGECRSYLKIMHQVKEPGLDSVADDVATTALDILMSEAGIRRAGRNPFLLGY